MNCNPIPGASNSTSFVTNSNFVGSTLRYLVTALNAVGSETATSDATSVIQANAVAPSNTTLPSISGTSTQGQTLLANPGDWTGTAPIAYAYQWIRCDLSNVCSNIASVTTQAYTLGAAEVGMTLKVRVTATNTAGTFSALSNPTSVVQGLFDFSGFLPPVYDPPTLNLMKAGGAVAVKFSLNGNKGLGILSTTQSIKIDCDSLDSDSVTILDTVTAGNSSLTYDETSDQYNYVWKTVKNWGGSCRQLRLTFTDGTTQVANFQLK